jgi:hypothetical protein
MKKEVIYGILDLLLKYYFLILTPLKKTLLRKGNPSKIISLLL